jgi:hypothetical protein
MTDDIDGILKDATCNDMVSAIKGLCDGFQPSMEMLSLAIGGLITLWHDKYEDGGREDEDTQTFNTLLGIVYMHLNYKYPEFLKTLAADIRRYLDG